MPGNKILVISSEKEVRSSLRYILEAEGYICQTAENSREIEQKIIRNSPNLVIFNCRTASKTEQAMINRIRSLAPGILIVLLISYSFADFAHKEYLAGTNAYLFTPVDFDELLRLLKTLLNHWPSVE